MDDWEIFSETSLPEKKKILTVTMEVITDADYVHAKRVCKHF